MIKEQTSKIDVLKGQGEKQKMQSNLAKKLPFIRRNKTNTENMSWNWSTFKTLHRTGQFLFTSN